MSGCASGAGRDTAARDILLENNLGLSEKLLWNNTEVWVWMKMILALI